MQSIIFIIKILYYSFITFYRLHGNLLDVVCVCGIILVHHHSSFPRTTKHLASLWVQEQGLPHSEASGNKDYMTLNKTVGILFSLNP